MTTKPGSLKINLSSVIIALAAACCGLQASAADNSYQPMLTEGKTWCEATFYCLQASSSTDKGPFARISTYRVEEDTIINGMQCKLVRCNDSAKRECFREVDRRVYYIPDHIINAGGNITEDDMYLLYDFNLHKGESVTVRPMEYYDGPLTYTVQQEDSVTIGKRRFRRLTFSGIGPVIEGLGSPDGLTFQSIYEPTDGSRHAVVGVMYHKDFYLHNDLMAAPSESSAIKSPVAPRQEDSAAYDLAGRRLHRPQPGQPYVSDGKVRVSTR
ncbi:MAG: hypothetical protein K2K99_06140 [Muribaculaceae bacterium]|nr:hypothetical protein [Muribaculaceae bacterium]MDE6509761.1 hypothetical protein [Muribaculaceae bacterium]